MPTLHRFDVAAYCKLLLDRFRNPALQHRTWQIAMDGSQKLPQRLLGTIRDRLAKGQPIDRLALGVAAWMRYVTRWSYDEIQAGIASVASGATHPMAMKKRLAWEILHSEGNAIRSIGFLNRIPWT